MMKRIRQPRRRQWALSTGGLAALMFALCEPDTGLAQSPWVGTLLTSAARAISSRQNTTRDQTTNTSRKGKAGQEIIPAASGTGTPGKIAKWVGSPTPDTLGDSVITESGGGIGIGTTTPGSKLEVAGDVRGKASGPAFYLYDTSGTVDARQFYFWNSGGLILGRWVNDANSAVVAETITFRNNGNVGIGTTNPNRLLHVGANNSVGGIRVEGPLVTGTGLFSFSMGGNGIFGIDAPNIFGGRFIVTENGNVGIGTTAPTAKLHVVGDVTVTGNIAAKYQDVAEWVPAGHSLPPGTVVVLNPEKSNQVLPSSRPYDTKVAGVISSSPGLTLGEAGEGKVLVATTGRVKVKVDATRAPIRVGDLLVTSDREGLAMRSEPLDLGGTPIHRPGTLIGKALEPLQRGVGEILVLLSLQ